MPTFETPEPITATIEVSVGDIRLVAGDRTDTVVEVRPADDLNAADVKAMERTEVEFSNGTLLVKGPRFRGMLFGKGGAIDVVVELPAGSQVRGSSDLGDLYAQGHFGECRFKTSMGNIDVDETARLRASSGMGNVHVARATGHADVSTGSGDLRITEIDGTAVLKNSNGETHVGEITGDLRASSANGDIVVDRAHTAVRAKTASGDIRLGEVIRDTVVLETAIGEVEVGIRQGSAAWLVLNTVTGQVHNSLTAADGPSQTDETVEVQARSTTGDIVIRRA
jgi:hypothetical protein